VVEYQFVACRILRSRIDPGEVGVSVSCLPLYPQAHADRSADLLVNHSSRCNTANLKTLLSRTLLDRALPCGASQPI
jgi:hypothetical protein